MNQDGNVKSLQSRHLTQARTVTFVGMLGIVAACSTIGRAQTTTSGQINGTVTDSSGALVIGANISVVNTATGVSYHTTTDNLGSYHVTQLPPGSYNMEAARIGFRTEKLEAFRVYVDQTVQENVTLTVGQSVQTVSVSAATLLLDTETTNQGQVVETQVIDNMPLNGRDVLQLAQLSAGVTPIIPGMSSPASQWTTGSTAIAVSISVAGMREDDVSYLYDGIETRDAWYGAAGLLPSPDFVQEFKVEQSGATADYGDGGAFVDVVTRSGTNKFHGTAYEYVRNNNFDARNYFDVGAPPPFHQNQFGGSLGGPIRKDKMFFFFNYEGFRQIQPADEYENVPTAQQIAGNFMTDSKQLLNPENNYQPFPGNQIGSQYFNSIGQKILALYPAPNGTYPGGKNYFDISNTTNNWDQENARYDYKVSNADNVFVRFTNQNQTTSETYMTAAREILFPSDPKNLAVGWTHVFSAHLVNNVRYGWSHTETGEQRADGYDAADENPLGMINEADAPGGYGYPEIGITNYGNPGSTEGTDIFREGMNMWTESLMLQKGRHQISAGADIRYEPIYSYEDWSATNISFNGSYTGDPVADLLLGIPSSSGTAIGSPTMNLRSWYQAYYVQDEAQLTRRLKVNLGARWEHNQQPVETANRVGSFDFATDQALAYPATSALGLGRAMVKPVDTNFSPRIGFNWTPSARANTDVKGGFGIYYLQPDINQYTAEVDTTNLYNVVSYTNSPAAVGTPILFTLSDLYGPSLPNVGSIIGMINPNNKTPYTYEWNLSIDHALKDWFLEISYLGSAAHHFEERPNLDPVTPAGTFPYTGYSGIIDDSDSGSSFYSGLIARVEHRYSSGFSLLGSYTRSKCLGWDWQDTFTYRPYDLRADRGHCQEDMTENLAANTIYELPFGRSKAFLNKGALTDAVVGGWKVAAIAQLHSGPWLTLGSSQNLGFGINPLPNVSGPVNNSSLNSGLGKNGKLGPYFNTQNVHPVTAEGVQGDSPVQSIYGPGSAEWDLAGDKTWEFADRYGLTFRADVFNAFNRVNFIGLDTGVNDSTFGNVTGANIAREIQLSLRFSF
jgi:Carboxypeptidase regulatory-like domain